MEMPKEIKEFLETLLADAGLPTETDEATKEGMVKELYQRLDSFIASSIIDSLAPEKLDEFMKLTEEGKSKEEIEQFLQNNVPNSQEVMQKAFMDFREMYLREETAAPAS